MQLNYCTDPLTAFLAKVLKFADEVKVLHKIAFYELYASEFNGFCYALRCTLPIFCVILKNNRCVETKILRYCFVTGDKENHAQDMLIDVK